MSLCAYLHLAPPQWSLCIVSRLAFQLSIRVLSRFSSSVKVIYRELVATLTTKTPKSKAWEECLPGIPPINPVKALNANFKSKIFTNQTKANAYKVIMKLLWFGEKCTPLHKISHLQWCNACHPKCKCATCDKQSCKCICHIDPTAREFNTLHHILFCPFLYPFWNMIHLLALSLSIYFPPETHLLKWSIVSAHMDKFQNQPMILTWQAIYNIYINMIIYHHYFKFHHTNIMINTFNNREKRIRPGKKANDAGPVSSLVNFLAAFVGEFHSCEPLQWLVVNLNT